MAVGPVADSPSGSLLNMLKVARKFHTFCKQPHPHAHKGLSPDLLALPDLAQLEIERCLATMIKAGMMKGVLALHHTSYDETLARLRVNFASGSQAHPDVQIAKVYVVCSKYSYLVETLADRPGDQGTKKSTCCSKAHSRQCSAPLAVQRQSTSVPSLLALGFLPRLTEELFESGMCVCELLRQTSSAQM